MKKFYLSKILLLFLLITLFSNYVNAIDGVVTDSEDKEHIVKNIQINCCPYSNYIGLQCKKVNSITFYSEKDSSHIETILLIDIKSIEIIKDPKIGNELKVELFDGKKWAVAGKLLNFCMNKNNESAFYWGGIYGQEEINGKITEIYIPYYKIKKRILFQK